MSTLLIAITSIVLSVAAQFLLKAGMSSVNADAGSLAHATRGGFLSVFTNIYIIAGFALYGLSAVIWLSVLSRWDVSKAYPLIGLGFALTVVIGLFAGEQVTALRIGGIALICAGVYLVAQT